MKCLIAIVLLGVCWQMPATCQSDDKADPVNLKSELELLREQVATLKADLAKVERERDELRAELKTKTDSEATAADDPTVAPVGTTWTGKTLDQKGNGGSSEWRVTARDDKNVTFRTQGEFGAIWEYDATFTSPKEFKLVAVRRIQKNSKVKNKDLEPVGAVTGRGSITAKNQLTAEIHWKEGKLDMKFLGDFVEPKVKE